MTDRDHFAAAALTGLLAQGDDGSFSEESYVRGAYRWADAMLRERAKTNHDAAPEAIAGTPVAGDTPKPISGCVSDRSNPINGPDPDSRVWETHTPATHATQGECSKPREGKEPVAWAVMPSNSDYCVTLSTRKEAAKKAAERKVEVGEYATMDDIVIVPLYRHQPCQDVSQKNLTLTDRERGAIERAVDSIASTMPYESQQGAADWKTLRGLLERLGGEK